jgi:hypothetical protein
LLAPGEVIEFFISGTLHLLFDIRISRNHGMALVQRLRSNFARMVNPHEPGSMRFLFVRKVSFVDIASGILACGTTGRSGDGTKRVISAGEQAIQRGQLSFLHSRDYSNARPGDGILRAPKKAESL